MKQCPNPNCILYTRLEELPDAYLRCPGCGGQLVDATLSTGALQSGHLTGRGSQMPSGSYREAFEEEYDAAFDTPPPTSTMTRRPDAAGDTAPETDSESVDAIDACATVSVTLVLFGLRKRK